MDDNKHENKEYIQLNLNSLVCDFLLTRIPVDQADSRRAIQVVKIKML
jgi:hypothetical protein